MIFDNEEFGYWSVTVERPLRLRVYPDREIPAHIFKKSDELVVVKNALVEAAKIAFLDDWTAFAKATKLKAGVLKKIRPFITEKDPTAQPLDGEADIDLRDTESIPFTYEGGIDAFMRNEVLPYAPDAYVDEKKTQIGYEIKFTRYFKPQSEAVDLGVLVEKIYSLQKYMSLDFFLTGAKRYDAYQDVDEIWIHELPLHWETIKIKRLFDERVEKGYPNELLLAATQNMGVVQGSDFLGRSNWQD